MYKKKGRKSAVHTLPTTTKPQKTGKVLTTENHRQNGAPLHHNVSERESICTPDGLYDFHHIKRKSTRIRANGIVALTNFAKPVVTKIYDISPGGVSFLHANERDITESALKMDILIFDILTNFEYLISQVKGRIKSKKLVAHPKSKVPTWQYSVAFVDLDHEKQESLRAIVTRIPPVNDQVFYECCLTPIHG